VFREVVTMRRTRSIACAGAFLALVLLAAGAARAEEVTRESYKAAVEPICRANTRANERIFAGVRSEVRHGQLKSAARRFNRAAAALRGTVGELRQVPRPPADRARLSRWLAKAGRLASSFALIARKLAAGEKGKAGHLVARLTYTAEAANALVFEFEFHYCRLEPSKFT
jgi:hypothetical protein